MAAANLQTYRLTPAAQRDLEEIWLYSASQWSAAQADRYVDILEDVFERLVLMPKLARERTEFDPPVRIHPSAEHLIVYRIRQDYLEILRVLGAGQNWAAILQALDQ